VQLQDYILQVQELLHDLSSVDWTQQEFTNAVNGARKRVALDTHCVRQLYSTYVSPNLFGGSTITQQETYPLTGGVMGVKLTAAGSGFTGTPTVTIGPPAAGGTQATAVALVAGGVVTQINMTSWGLGYVSTPSVTISGGGGNGATGTAIAMFNVFDIKAVSVLWGVERWAASWMPFGPYQAFCRANTSQFRYPGVWTLFWEMQQLYLYPVPDQPYGLDIDAVSTPSPLVNLTDVDLQIIDPVSDAVQFYAAYLLVTKMQKPETNKYWEGQYDKRLSQIIATKQSARVTNIYNNWRRRFARL
jgi:hypothetical protein